MTKTLFFDLETTDDLKILDIGAVLNDEQYHGKSLESLAKMISEADFICGHNIIFHDIPALIKSKYGSLMQPFPDKIDTLMFSPLFFPDRPYHKLIKDYKLVSEELNNPLADAEISRTILREEIDKYKELDKEFQSILYNLLNNIEGFHGFFKLIEYHSTLLTPQS